MTSSARDQTGIDLDSSDANEWLESLLGALAAEGEFQSACRLLLERCCAALNSRRGYVMVLDSHSRQLVPVVYLGIAEDERPAWRSTDDLGDPFVVSALGMQVVACKHGPPRSGVLRTSGLLSLPLPQLRNDSPLRFLDDSDISRRLIYPCAITPTEAGNAWRESAAPTSASPFGAVVVEASAAPSATINTLATAARLSGPVLARLHADAAKKSRADASADERSVLTSIVNSLPDPIVIMDRERRILVQNQRARHMLAICETDSEGRRRAVEINNLLLTSHLAKGGTTTDLRSPGESRELNMVDPDDGTDLLFEVLSQPLEDNSDATVSVLRDVTDLRRASGELELQVQRVRLAEYEAKRESDRLHLILTNVADPILVTDDRSNIILMNRQAELLFGSATADIGYATGDRSAAVRANDTKFTTFISNFSLSPETARRESMVLMRPGAEPPTIPMEVLAGKISDKRGEPLAIVSVLHDLTEQVENERLYTELKNFSSELEARVREATADLADQNVRLQWQSRELEKANRLKSEFLASMSHELRTPINALIGYTALMLDRIYGELNERQEEGLTRIRSAAQHLLALINDILDLAKIEAGRMPLRLEPTVLQDVIREASIQIDPLVKKKGLSYRWVAPTDPLEMITDRTKVKQIMLNLLSNAVKFTHTGSITLSATLEGAFVTLAVIDTGIGIRKEDLATIWDDFRQVDQSRTREFGGTGLGLSITRKLTDALGGRVSLASEYGSGSTFTVVLPVDSEPDAQENG